MDENKARLDAIVEYIDKNLTTNSSVALLEIRELATGEQVLNQIKSTAHLQKIILSCDASIKENPGGPSAVGIIIEMPGKSPLTIAQTTPATSNNQAEYDAVYYGLTTLTSLHNVPQFPIEVRSDSKLVIEQLNGDMKCNDEKLQKRRDLILELIGTFPTQVQFVWRPRNSTSSLKNANFAAQDLLGVPRH